MGDELCQNVYDAALHLGPVLGRLCVLGDLLKNVIGNAINLVISLNLKGTYM